MTDNEIPRCAPPETLWEPPDAETLLDTPDQNSNIWGLKTVWCYQEPELHIDKNHAGEIIEDSSSDSIFLDSSHYEYHDLYPIDELSDSFESDYDYSLQSVSSPISNRDILSPSEKLLAECLKRQYEAGSDGCYTSEDEDDFDPIVTTILKCREAFNALDPNPPPKLIIPKVKNWPSLEEKELLDKYAMHYGVRVDADGGVYTDGEESIFEEQKSVSISIEKPLRLKKTRRKDYIKHKLFTEIQSFFLKKFSQVSKCQEDDRLYFYAEFNIFRLIPFNDFSISRCIELIDCMLSAVEERPGIVFYCAEFCKYQCDRLSLKRRNIFVRAILRCIKVNIFSEEEPDEETRKNNFLYITLLGHLYNLEVCPPKIIRYFVSRFFQTNNFEDNRIAYFDSDYTVYVTRLLGVIYYKWTSIKENQMNGCDFPRGLNDLKKWLKHLKRVDNSPPHVIADISVLFSNFTTNGKLHLTNYTRTSNCEIQAEFDDLVLITKNSYGRKLFCCREMLALYSYTFYQFFYGKFLQGKKEIYLDVEFCAMREILRVIYHCDRKFTAVYFRLYTEDVLLVIAKAAQQLDMPIIFRLCEEQLYERLGLNLALKSYNLGLPGITNRCLPYLDQSELHDLLKFVLYGRQANEKPMRSSDFDIIWSSLEFIQFRHPRRFTHCDSQSEMIFPMDFTTPWVLSDIAIETLGSGGRFLFANRTVLSIFSPFFKDYPYIKTKKWRGHWRVETNERYSTVRAALRIIHHVKQKFVPQRLPTLLPTMLVRLYRCSQALDFPLIIRLCNEQLEIASFDYLISLLNLLDPSLKQPNSREECFLLIKVALQAS